MDDTELFEGTWAIVGSGPIRYIGKICTPPVSCIWPNVDATDGQPLWVTLNPAFDYVVQLQPTPQGITKIPILTPLDMFSEPCPLRVLATSFVLFEDMQDSDRERYKKFVAQTMAEMMKARVKKTTGIELVSQIPGNGRG